MNEIKEKIIKALNETCREGIEDLIAYLTAIGFFEAPASSANHLHCEGGLAEHSYNVFKHAHNIALALMPDALYKELQDSITIAALLHDVGKCGDHGRKMYVENILKSGKASDAKPYKRNPDLLPIDHATRSLCIINRFIDLTEQEEFAIRFHDGLYESANYALKGAETPLYITIHTADLWASHITEKE